GDLDIELEPLPVLDELTLSQRGLDLGYTLEELQLLALEQATKRELIKRARARATQEFKDQWQHSEIKTITLPGYKPTQMRIIPCLHCGGRTSVRTRSRTQRQQQRDYLQAPSCCHAEKATEFVSDAD